MKASGTQRSPGLVIELARLFGEFGPVRATAPNNRPLWEPIRGDANFVMMPVEDDCQWPRAKPRL